LSGFRFSDVFVGLLGEHLHQLVADFDSEFPHSGDADSLVMFFLAIDCEEQICDETSEYLCHQPIRASGDYVVNI
jgi:hypothetical protein